MLSGNYDFNGSIFELVKLQICLIIFCSFRHWQELGYLILYITGRPDIQKHRVMAWLAHHNFPHGLVSFADGLSTDPLGHKADHLRNVKKLVS